MSRVVVVGGGYAGLACSVRLAKLGHAVTLVERSPTLGGALRAIARDGFTWDAGPSYTLVPAVLRDLFRKSGRPLERELDLRALPVLREHRFADGSRLALPAGSRGGQTEAVEALAPGAGVGWTAYVDAFGPEWEVLRRDYLERPWAPDVAPRELGRVLLTRESLRRRVRRLPDERLRVAATAPVRLDGHDPARVPAWVGASDYLERSFGAWTVAGGLHSVAEVLVRRLSTRRVTVMAGVEVRDLVVRSGRVAGVRLPDGHLDADVVVVAADPRRLPALAPYVARSVPVDPPLVTHLGLAPGAPDLAPEVLLHGDPLVAVRTGGAAPTGGAAWTVLVRGRATGDVLDLLAARGLDVRRLVVARIDRTGLDAGGSPWGVRWDGRDTVRRRLGPTTPVPGVFAAGAHATPGAGLPFVGLSAALVVQAVGPA